MPGGQVLGATHDYTQRLLDFALLADGAVQGDDVVPTPSPEPMPVVMPRVNELLAREGLMETPLPTRHDEPGDARALDVSR